MKKVYISGPMTGIQNMNECAFKDAELILKQKGYTTINPVFLGQCLESSGQLDGIGESEKYQKHLNNDLSHVPKCDAIYLLRGWESSRGALAEFALAKICKLELMFEEGAK